MSTLANNKESLYLKENYVQTYIVSFYLQWMDPTIWMAKDSVKILPLDDPNNPDEAGSDLKQQKLMLNSLAFDRCIKWG